MARRRLFAVHSPQWRCARRRRTLRIDQQPQLSWPPRPQRTNPPPKSGDGCGCRVDGPSYRCASFRRVSNMTPFTVWTAIAAPFDQANIDTNQICPTRFNKLEKGPKFANVLFHDLRFDSAGAAKTDFILNREPYRKAGIIVADRNFGSGSSRESAVFAVVTFGIRAIIAPSFGEIFANNCLKNAVLPVVLDSR